MAGGESKKNTEEGKQLLENAYRLSTPESNEAYYNALAQSYNTDFVTGLGYSLAHRVAEKYKALAAPEDSPIADIGCGTGVIGTALNGIDAGVDIVGMDISTAMLQEAEKTHCYSELVKIDLTSAIGSRHLGKFGAILSSGTFTHGHLGPESLLELLTLAKTNALFVITINKLHFVNKGFDKAITSLLESGSISHYDAGEVPIYNAQDHEHSNDVGLLTSFRKTE